MGIFGTYGAFQGLGKPSIKLEFEDNEALLDFQRRMQEDGGDNPDGGNFTPTELAHDLLSRVTTGRPYLKATKGGELEGLTQAQLYNYIYTKVEPLSPVNVRGLVRSDKEEIFKKEFGECDKNGYYTVATPIGDVYVNHTGLSNHLTKHAVVKEAVNVIKKTLQNPAVIFDGKDSDGNKTIVFVKAFLINGKPVFAVVSSIDRQAYYLKSNIPPHSANYIYNLYKKGGENILHPSLLGCDEKGLTLNSIPPELPPFEVIEFRLPITITENGAKSCIFNENSLGAPGDTYLVTDTRKKPRKELDDMRTFAKYDIRKLTGEELSKMQTDDPLLYEQIKSDMTAAKVQPQPEKKDTPEIEHISPLGKDLYYTNVYFPNGMGIFEMFHWAEKRYPGEVVVLVQIDETPGKRNKYYQFVFPHWEDTFLLQNVDKIKDIQYLEGWPVITNMSLVKRLEDAYKTKQNRVVNIIRPRFKKTADGIGRTAPNILYNNNDIMECRGMRPTYTILKDYSSFFDADAKVTNAQTFAGFGLDDTLKLITKTCRAHWKDCARIAQHLKGDSKLQSAFNLWHWMRHNIKYEYDREGREEVRTPLRVWADRDRGVDCDCLSVFAWCVLKCMGYNPAFELVAFHNKPQYSHIFINLDGIVVDRVWFVFNERPPAVTKSRIYEVDVAGNNIKQDLAGLF